MKYLVIIILLLSSIPSKGQLLEEGSIVFHGRDDGNVFLSVGLSDEVAKKANWLNDTSTVTDGYFLFFLPPKFKERRITEKIKVDKTMLDKESEDKDSIRYFFNYKYIPNYTYPELFRNKLDANCISADPTYQIALQFRKEEAKYQVKTLNFSKKDLEKDSVLISYTYYELKENAQVIVSTHFDKTLTKDLSYSKIIFLNGRYWSEFRQVLCSSPTFSYSIKTIQIALKREDYKIIVNGVLNDSTKVALLDFQKKNKLPIGSLDVETLRKLGIVDVAKGKAYHYLSSPIK